MKSRFIWLLLLIAAIFVFGCKKDEDEETPPPAPTEGDHASGSATSDQEATIETPDGARMLIPMGAVPRYENGDPGTVVFSIEEDTDASPPVPTGHTIGTPVYQFGPEAMVLARPIEISIPLNEGVSPENVFMIRINPSTNEPEIYPSHYDAERNAVVAQTVSLSMWFGGYYPPIETGWGCVHVYNPSVTTWFTFCVDSFILEYPDLDLQYMPSFAIGGLWAPVGHIGITNESNFRMPQGTFWICTQYSPDQQPNEYTRSTDVITITDPWNESLNEALCSQYTAGSFGPDTGRCNCSPAPSLPVGTGAVQVSLTWYVNDINGTDMDLHLVEPGGFEIYYNATSSPNGGILDYDDTCGDFRQGTTENIYYASDPPSGEYIVSVHYYGDYCGGSHPTQSFAVRTIVQGITQTFNRSLAPGEEIEITRFSISGSGPARFLPPHDGIVIRTDLPAK